MLTSTAGSSINSKGFTLVELAIVVLLIALFSALTVPMVTGVGENRLDSSARRLAGTVKYLYNEAALNGREYRLVFDIDKGTYQGKSLETDGDLAEKAGLGKKRLLKGDVQFEDVNILGRGRFSSGEISMGISPVGWMEETIVHLRDKRGRKLTLRMMPYTGTTKVYEGYRDFTR